MKNKVFLMIFSLVLFLQPISMAQSQDSFSDKTSGGSLLVEISNSTSNLIINFINPQNNRIQEHIDYKISILKNGEITKETTLLHTSKGTLEIPEVFSEKANYEIIITVSGILFTQIPQETVTLHYDLNEKSRLSTLTSEQRLLEQCTIGNYNGGLNGMGSWSITIEKEEDGICFLNYSMEVEGGYAERKCEIPVNEIKTINSNKVHTYEPLEYNLINQYCVIVNQGNIFDNMLLVVIIYALVILTVSSAFVYFITLFIAKKILHKNHSKKIGGITVALFILILVVVWQVYLNFY